MSKQQVDEEAIWATVPKMMEIALEERQKSVADLLACLARGNAFVRLAERLNNEHADQVVAARAIALSQRCFDQAVECQSRSKPRNTPGDLLAWAIRFCRNTVVDPAPVLLCCAHLADLKLPFYVDAMVGVPEHLAVGIDAHLNDEQIDYMTEFCAQVQLAD